MHAVTEAIPVSGRTLMADLHVGPESRGLVVFVHGSGSSRMSPRNRQVADHLNQRHLATVLFDLLTPGEARERSAVFDVDLLAQRLLGVLAWLRRQEATAALPVGLFGASTGAAAALQASVDPGAAVSAIVSRGGRPDLAPAALPRVTAPTLLLVGGLDGMVLDLNRQAAEHLRCPHEVRVIPGASHLFEEPGTLEAVAAAARSWFEQHLTAPGLVGGAS